MNETHRIYSQLKRAYQGPAWHGPSLRELLDGVTADQAAAHPIPGAHSIWELVNHIIAWEQISQQRLEGKAMKHPADDVNFPPVNDTSEPAWQKTLEQLAASNQLLRDAVKLFDDSRLDDLVPEANYSNYFMLHGVIQHDLYHAGQIALLKKAVQ